LKLPLSLACLTVFAWTQTASAATVVVVRPPGPSAQVDETLTLLHGELASVGLEDTTIERPAADGSAVTDLRSWPEQLAEERSAVAVIDVLGGDDVSAVDVWVRKAPGRFEVTRVTVERQTSNSSARLAIRAIEALRASLLEVDLATRYKQRPRATKAPPPPAPASALKPGEPKHHRDSLGLELGASLLASPGGVGPAVLPTVRLDWAVRPRLLVEASGAALGSRPAVTTQTGSASVGREYLLLGGCYRPWADHWWWPFFSIAAGVQHASVKGNASVEMDTHAVGQWSALADAGFGATVRFYRLYHLSLSGHVQLAQPYLAIHFDEPTAATAGRPNLLLTLAVGAWL